MVNEVVMYQSMFLLGVIMFGFFATSFNNYMDFAETVTLDNNLERVLQEVGEEILNLLDEASALRGKSGSFNISVELSLDADYALESYIIQPEDTNGNVSLVALVKNEEIARHPLSINSDDSLSQFSEREIDFSGSLVSSSINTRIVYSFSSLSDTETIQLLS